MPGTCRARRRSCQSGAKLLHGKGWAGCRLAASPALLQLYLGMPGCLGWYPALVNSIRNAMRPVGKKTTKQNPDHPTNQRHGAWRTRRAFLQPGLTYDCCFGGCRDAFPEKLWTLLSHHRSGGAAGDSERCWMEVTRWPVSVTAQPVRTQQPGACTR